MGAAHVCFHISRVVPEAAAKVHETACLPGVDLVAMGKKAKALSEEQKAQYADVMKALASKGVLSAVAAAPEPKGPEPAAEPSKRCRSKTPPAAAAEAEPKAKTRKTTPKAPEPAPAPKAKAKNGPKAKAEPKKGIARATPLQLEDQPSEAPAPDSDKPVSRDGSGSLWDPDLKVTISWANFQDVMKAIRKTYPEEDEDSTKDALERALGPCPAHLLPLQKDEPVPPAAASEEHPGPVLEDASMQAEDDAEDDCDGEPLEGTEEEQEEEQDAEQEEEQGEEQGEEQQEEPAPKPKLKLTRTSSPVDPSQLETQLDAFVEACLSLVSLTLSMPHMQVLF